MPQESKPNLNESGREKVFPRETPEVQVLKERLEKLEISLKEKEKALPEQEKIIKEEIKKYFQELQKTPEFAPPLNTRDETEEIKKLEPSQQVGALISLVFEKGLHHAIFVARTLDNPAILDEFHDTLVDRYYMLMIEKGVLKHS